MSTSESNPKPTGRVGGQEIYGVGVERWGWGSISVNLVLSLLNLGIAIASGSLAVTSEMVHNLVDLMASVVVLIGLRISQRRSKSFPYGLYKVENVVSVMLAGLIFFTGYEIVREALFSYRGQTIVSLWMLVGVTLSAVIPLLFSHFELRTASSPQPDRICPRIPNPYFFLWYRPYLAYKSLLWVKPRPSGSTSGRIFHYQDWLGIAKGWDACVVRRLSGRGDSGSSTADY